MVEMRRIWRRKRWVVAHIGRRHADEARLASRMCEEGQDSCRRQLQQDRKRQMVSELPEGRESVRINAVLI
ncbi:hypothetical protein BHE74_00019139 [Ensete ventricosum]|nr:hypothetical protein BHE74_00019139 [Ensete ventricosum]